MSNYSLEISDAMATNQDEAAAPDRPLSIAAAANLIGVTTHTLRKWESRHGIVVPHRTDTGRRFYDAEQVRSLKLVRQLLDQGHALSHLAELTGDELQLLLAKHNPAVTGQTLTTVDLVGPNIARQLQGWGEVQANIGGTDEQTWLREAPPLQRSDAIVFETNTLPGHIIDDLIELRQTHYRRMIVIARMTSRRTRRQLRQHGITAIDTLIPVSTLLALLEHTPEATPVTSPSEEKFTVQQLAAIAAMTPSLDCECPNHIAQLLIDISAFEQYSKECKDTDPAEAKLHAYLGDITGQARVLLETALVAVAEADNLDLTSIAHH